MIMKRLKKETQDDHLRLESLPYFKALIAHQLPLECYVKQLRALAVVHGVLENELAALEDQRVSAVWENGLRKLSLLEEDLAFFTPRVIFDAPSPIGVALAMAEKIRLRRLEAPLTLLGYLYVLEGSTLGNNMHQPDISATFHLSGFNGCRYYSSYQDQVKAHWKRFSEQFKTALEDPSLHDAVIEAAHEAFSGLESLYTALYPLGKSEKLFHVTRINPEAGNHPIPEDEREIQAALKASQRAWNVFPYYGQRYGTRGKRFSDSDTCWLVTLTALDPEPMQGQIDWLCRVVATRGMPTLMMEHTLRFLYDELCHAVPDNSAAYGKLAAAADRLKQNRLKWFPEAEFTSLAAAFEKAAGSDFAVIHKNTGNLLVSAVADEKNGIVGTVDALRIWLTDDKRFSRKWIGAVAETLERAIHLATGNKHP
jgi:heme oxygenase